MAGGSGWNIVTYTKRLWVRFPVMYLGCGFVSQLGCVWEATYGCFSLSFPLSQSNGLEAGVEGCLRQSELRSGWQLPSTAFTGTKLPEEEKAAGPLWSWAAMDKGWAPRHPR